MPTRAEAGGEAGDEAAHDAVEWATASLPPRRYLLAVSGGRDSMVLMTASARVRDDVCMVATFDHGTGPAATQAAALVEREASALGLPVISGQLNAPVSTEAEWRAARWRFLRGWAHDLRATVVTAHTMDDQLETVVMRVLRGAGARGLAAMYAPSPTCRPLLAVPRAVVAAYATARRVPFVEDPSNQSRAHLRNRVRLDLLPALLTARPDLGAELLTHSQEAAEWRAAVESVVDGLGVVETEPGRVAVPVASLATLDPRALAVLWPAIAGRAGVALDWRGTDRLAAFTSGARAGGEIPLSGGARVRRTATSFVVTATRTADATILRE